jgi:hypothetical protein
MCAVFSVMARSAERERKAMDEFHRMRCAICDGPGANNE